MLVLKLRRGDSARIGPDVVVTVLREDGPNAMVVTIDAPPSLRITRQPAIALSVPNKISAEPVKPVGANNPGRASRMMLDKPDEGFEGRP